LITLVEENAGRNLARFPIELIVVAFTGAVFDFSCSIYPLMVTHDNLKPRMEACRVYIGGSSAKAVSWLMTQLPGGYQLCDGPCDIHSSFQDVESYA
jgi:hypothetical protein